LHLTLLAYPLLFATGLTAGLVDSIAGGGGLIALPVLLNLGVPAPLALGTNKLQSCAGTLTASRHYLRSGLVDLAVVPWGAGATFAGALLGAWTVERIDSSALGRLIPWLLAAILLYVTFQPHVGRTARPPRMGRRAFCVLFGLGLGFYDGFFGPGVGSLWTISFVLALGFDFSRATGNTKVMNAASNLASLTVFIPAGRVLYAAGLAMCAGQLIGARLGAHLVVKRGARFVRPFFLVIVALTLLRLLIVSRHR
jgi:uncharacterized protein